MLLDQTQRHLNSIIFKVKQPFVVISPRNETQKILNPLQVVGLHVSLLAEMTINLRANFANNSINVR